MKIEFNLNYRSLLQESLSLDFSSASKKGAQGFMLEGRSSRDGFERTGELASLGLYSEKIMLRSTSASMSVQESSIAPVQNDFVVEVPKISPQQAADNILGFVERRIQLEKDQGASEEKLNGLMAEAREGVEKGYAQARSDLEALGMMSEELESEIDESYSLVDEGLTKIAKGISGDEGIDVAPAVVRQDAESDDDDVESPKEAGDSVEVDRQSPAAAYSELGIQAKYKASSSFSLTTQDGDVVEISFSSKQAFAAMVEGSMGQFGFDASMKQVDRFNLSVSGDLDEGEMQAINDLLMQLSDVSEKFFSGDVLSAFDSALAVGFDGAEIAEFSLNLRQSSMERISSSYEGLPSFGSSPEMRYQPLIDQVNNVKLLSEHLSQFEYAFDQIRTLFSDVLNSDAAQIGHTDSGLLTNINKFVDYLL